MKLSTEGTSGLSHFYRIYVNQVIESYNGKQSPRDLGSTKFREELNYQIQAVADGVFTTGTASSSYLRQVSRERYGTSAIGSSHRS
jgi:hypothetical protein